MKTTTLDTTSALQHLLADYDKLRTNECEANTAERDKLVRRVLRDFSAGRRRVKRLREVLDKIGHYEGKGPPTTPWQEIVADVGRWARDVLEETKE